MSCTEITAAIAWAKQTTHKQHFPVTAFFTKHSGTVSEPAAPGSISSERDFCWYAVGGLAVNAEGHLFGDLALSMNSGPGNDVSAMQAKLTSSLGVEISPDGTVSYQHKLNGKPVGGMPPRTVAAACVAGSLLSGVNQNEVIAVGVRRDPSMFIAQ